MALEVEAKLAAQPGFEVPRLDGAVPELVVDHVAPVVLDARYFDAEDLRLLRAGMTLRHRAGEGGPSGAWTLKTAVADTDDLARRDEWVVPGPLEDLPTELEVRIRPWLRAAPLVQVAHIRTDRRRTSLTVAGEDVGEVADDEVSVVVGDHVAARFREVEVECADEHLLQTLVDVLRAAGAGAPDPTPKLVRALGPRALEPPDLAPVDVDADATARDVLRAGMTAATLRVIGNDAVIRADRDPEGIHQARVGCRRLRSDLRTFAPLLDGSWADPVRAELRWLATELGAVRDLDVLATRLGRQSSELPARDIPDVEAALDLLRRQRDEAVAAAVAALDSARYLQLLDRLVELAADPPTTSAADALGAEVLPPLAGRAFARLRKHVRRLPKDPSDEHLHDLRIQAKKARYAADLALPVAPKRARRYTRALARLQGVLGDLHDAAVAERWLRDAVGGSDTSTTFVLGSLAEVQRAEQRALRRRWRAAWKDVDDTTLTRWMRG